MHRAEKPNRRSLGRRGRPPSLQTAIAAILQYRKALAAAGARPDVIDSLDGALQVLEANIQRQGELFRHLEPKQLDDKPDPLNGRDPRSLSMEETWGIIVDEATDRKTLERIAIQRFAVPKGSMRSFPNIPMLREKLMTLVRNVSAHDTIGSLSQMEHRRQEG